MYGPDAGALLLGAVPDGLTVPVSKGVTVPFDAGYGADGAAVPLGEAEISVPVGETVNGAVALG